MRARKMDRRISLYTVAGVQDAAGAAVLTRTLLANVAAEMRPTRGFEQTEGGRDQARAEKVFRIRWRSDVTNKHELDFDGVTYDITRIDEVGRRQGLDITALAKVS